MGGSQNLGIKLSNHAVNLPSPHPQTLRVLILAVFVDGGEGTCAEKLRTENIEHVCAGEGSTLGGEPKSWDAMHKSCCQFTFSPFLNLESFDFGNIY